MRTPGVDQLANTRDSAKLRTLSHLLRHVLHDDIHVTIAEYSGNDFNQQAHFAWEPVDLWIGCLGA